MDKRIFLKKLLSSTAGITLIGSTNGLLSQCTPSTKSEGSGDDQASSGTEIILQISLAQWSLHRTIFGDSRKLPWNEFNKLLKTDPDQLLQGTLHPLDFPMAAKETYGIGAVEYVNQFFINKAQDQNFINELNKRTVDQDVKSVLIMIDHEGDLGNTNEKDRIMSVENHYKWVSMARELGCHSIRVNARGEGSEEDVKDAAVDGLGNLSSYAKEYDINVIVENHGGYSSNGKWLTDVITQVNMSNCGTLPDFGNFCIERTGPDCSNEYDRYQGVRELMPFAKGVSAKSHEFDENGNEINTDFARMLNIVKEAGYQGYIGVEYEGSILSEDEGIIATKNLIDKLQKISV